MKKAMFALPFISLPLAACFGTAEPTCDTEMFQQRIHSIVQDAVAQAAADINKRLQDEYGKSVTIKVDEDSLRSVGDLAIGEYTEKKFDKEKNEKSCATTISLDFKTGGTNDELFLAAAKTFKLEDADWLKAAGISAEDVQVQAFEEFSDALKKPFRKLVSDTPRLKHSEVKKIMKDAGAIKMGTFNYTVKINDEGTETLTFIDRKGRPSSL
jgi:hypothetical protein